jgi:hypothetical protein
MALEAIPLSVNSDGNLRITRTAFAADPLSAAILAAGDDLTYSLITFDLGETQDTVNDPRLSLAQRLKKPGIKDFTLIVTYIFGDAGDVAASVLTEGSTGNLTLRYSIANSTVWAAAQIGDALTYTAGSQRKAPPTENGVQMMTQELFVSAVVLKDQAIGV